MLHIDECGQTAALLRLRDDRERKRCFSGRFRAVNLNDATSWKSAHAQGAIDQNVAGRNNIDVDDLFGAQTHNGAFAVVFCDLLNCEI
jgi:hypothetical protein